MRQPFHAGRRHGWRTTAQGRAGARGQFHPALFRPPADHRRQQRVPHVLAPRHRWDRNRVRSGLLLQHRAAGEGASARLADRRGAGAMVRAPARRKPVPRHQMASGLSALVWLRVCDHVPAAAAHERRAQGYATAHSRRAPMKWPRIRSRRTTAVSPWMSIIAREVEFSRGGAVEVYHAVEQADYIAIIAVTPGGKIPIVRQYRPALEAFVWELPAGLVDPGETPIDCCRRELLEETGLTARAIHALGETVPC